MEARRWLLASALCLAAVTLTAATPADDPVALANWAAPPYWTRPASGSKTIGTKHIDPALPNPSLAFHAVTPCRIVDTRGFGFTGPYGPPNLTAGNVRAFAVTSPGTSCGIPSGVAAVSFNFAVVNLSANGNLIVYPTGGSAPSVSSLNWTPVEGAISNAAVIALGSNSINVLVNGPAGSTVDLVVDVNGYYAADPVVSTLNGLSGDIAINPNGDITVTPGAGTITIGDNSTSANTPNTLVLRDASGNFSAGTITAALNGAASANVLKAGDTMTGTLTIAPGDLDLGTSPSTPFAGSILKGGVNFLHDTGSTDNIFVDINGYYYYDTSVTHLAGLSGAVTLVPAGRIAVNVGVTVVNVGIAASATNFPSVIARRDSSGNFTAGGITASLTGAASDDVLKTGDTMTGTLTAKQVDLGASPSSPTGGNIRKNGILFLHDGIGGGGRNVFAGALAGTAANIIDTTGIGSGALSAVGPGDNHAFIGASAGNGISTASFATGVGALASELDGVNYGSALGFGACQTSYV